MSRPSILQPGGGRPAGQAGGPMNGPCIWRSQSMRTGSPLQIHTEHGVATDVHIADQFAVGRRSAAVCLRFACVCCAALSARHSTEMTTKSDRRGPKSIERHADGCGLFLDNRHALEHPQVAPAALLGSLQQQRPLASAKSGLLAHCSLHNVITLLLHRLPISIARPRTL